MDSKSQRHQPTHSSFLPLVLLFTVSLALFGLFGYLSLRVNLLSPVWVYFFLYLTSYAVYVYASARVVPVAATVKPWVTAFVILSGIIFRLILVHSPPSLSTDIYRYVWDGRLTVHGVNPFRWSPSDPRLSWLRDGKIWMPMEYKPYQTVYMSVSQAIFALGSLMFGNNLIGFKLIYTLFDIGNVILLWRLLKQLGQPEWKVVWYAWCPLPIIEISLSGHQDVCGVFFFLLTFLLFAKSRVRLSSLTLAASVLTKGFPLLLIPLFARMAGWRYAVLAVVSLIVLGLPQILEAHAFLHGMQQYLMNVEVNGSIHALIDFCLKTITTKHIAIANQITDLIIVGFVVAMVINPVTSLQELMRRTLIIVCSCLMVVPTLFPWYLVWLIPIASCVGNRPSTAVIVLIGTSIMNYTFYFDHQTYWWSAWLEYVPFYTVLFWEWYKGYWRSADSAVSIRSGVATRRTFDAAVGPTLSPADG
jgi:alpha-1,6-mannosyltransferase